MMPAGRSVLRPYGRRLCGPLKTEIAPAAGRQARARMHTAAAPYADAPPPTARRRDQKAPALKIEGKGEGATRAVQKPRVATRIAVPPCFTASRPGQGMPAGLASRCLVVGALSLAECPSAVTGAPVLIVRPVAGSSGGSQAVVRSGCAACLQRPQALCCHQRSLLGPVRSLVGYAVGYDNGTGWRGCQEPRAPCLRSLSKPAKWK
jgi:hypothetical protein